MRKHLLFSLFLFASVISPTLFAADKAPLIYWEDLLPPGYDADKILANHKDDLARIEQLPDDSEEGARLLQKVLDSFNASPMNPNWDNKQVRLDGFIAPLDIQNGRIVRFLLVPYFGACIHSPAPPTNQTVYIEVAKGQGIPLEKADYPFLIKGLLQIDKSKTDIGDAGYKILKAHTRIDEDGKWLQPEN